MAKKKPDIGKFTKSRGASVVIDVERLIVSRLLVQANSGAGKSYAIRKLLEVTHGHVLQIVIDLEDEFHTLREKFDYILAGREGGDCPANPRVAKLLAHKLLEIGVSTIIGISELRADKRVRFVKLFLTALIESPRKLWRPALIVVDEAHAFCPQNGKAESAGAVIDLMTRGRKRGFCGVLATQRLSKLHKDAGAEANNKLIGRSALDVDMKRAADELGFTTREQRLELRRLKPGEFFAFGPAISPTVEKIMVGKVVTNHPKAGAGSLKPDRKGAPRGVLEQLGDLPAEVEQEQQTLVALQNQVRELKRDLKQKERGSGLAPKVDAEAIEKARKTFLEQEASIRDLKKNVITLERKEKRLLERFKSITKLASEPETSVLIEVSEPETVKRVMASLTPKKPRPLRVAVDELGSNGKALGRCERFIVQVLAQFPDGRTMAQIALQAGYAHGGGGFNNAMSFLRTQGYIVGDDDRRTGKERGYVLTESGHEAAGPVDSLPSGDALREHWKRHKKIGKCEAAILDSLAEHGSLSKEQLGEVTEYESGGGGFNNALSRLRTLGLITGGRRQDGGMLKISADLVG